MVTVTAATKRALENIGIGIGRLTTRILSVENIWVFSMEKKRFFAFNGSL